MIKTFNINNHIYSNTYIRIDTYINMDKLSVLNDCDFITSNQSETMMDYASRILDYELKNNNNVRKGQTPRLGATFTFLLDKQRTAEQLAELSEEVSGRIDPGLPFWSYLLHKSGCCYLAVYFSDRYYYANGKTEEIRARSDVYINKDTNRICKKDDPSAKLLRKKGDLIRTQTVMYSSKVKLFRFKGKKDCAKKMEELRCWYGEKIEELFKFSTGEGLIIKRFIYTDLEDKYQRNNARRWNKAFSDVEKAFDQAVERLIYIDLYDEESKKLIGVVFHKIRAFASRGYFRYGTGKRLKGYINLNSSDRSQRIYIDGFKARCLDEINKTMERILRSAR